MTLFGPSQSSAHCTSCCTFSRIRRVHVSRYGKLMLGVKASERRTWSFVTSNKIPRAKLSMCAFCNLHQLTHVKKRVTDLDLQYCKPLRKDSPGGMLGLMKTLSQNFSTGNYFIRLCLSMRIVVTKMFRYSGDLVCHVLSLRSV